MASSRTPEDNAREFGRLVAQGKDVRLALLVACSVQRRGRGRPSQNDANASFSKLTARAFAQIAGGAHDRVVRHLDAWNAMAERGLVKPSAELKPSDALDYEVPQKALDAFAALRLVTPSDDTDAGDPDLDRDPDQEEEPAPDPPPRRGRYSLADDPYVIEWVREQWRKNGWTRDEMVAASKAGTDGWPFPKMSLSNGSVSAIFRAIEAGEKAGRSWRHEDGDIGTPEERLRHVEQRIKTEGPSGELEFRYAVTKAVAGMAESIRLLRGARFGVVPFPVPEEPVMYAWRELQRSKWWFTACEGHLEPHVPDIEMLGRARFLRDPENLRGRGPAERQAFLDKADALEAKVRARMARRELDDTGTE